jgi:hypothetical protein
MRLRLLEAIYFGGEDKAAGEFIEASEQEAKILIAIGRAVSAEDDEIAGAKPKRGKGKYKRRDMRAEQRQYGAK